MGFGLQRVDNFLNHFRKQRLRRGIHQKTNNADEKEFSMWFDVSDETFVNLNRIFLHEFNLNNIA